MLLNLIETIIPGSLIMLSFLSFTNPFGVNRKASLWQGTYILIWSTFFIDEIIGVSDGDRYICLIVRAVQFMISLIFFFSVKYFTNPNYELRQSDIKHLILPLIHLSLLILEQESDLQLNSIVVGLLLLNSIFYMLLSLFRIDRHQKQVEQFSSRPGEINLDWLKSITIVLSLLTVVVALFNIIFHIPLNLFMDSAILISIYFYGYYSLKQKEIYPLENRGREDIISINSQEIDTKRKVISDEDMSILKVKLRTLMEEKRPYLDSDINLIKMAEMIAITPHQLSYLLNRGFNKNFFNFISGYRVEKAKSLLISDDAQKLSILGIAFESGFSSKTSFNTTFKKLTGTTPSLFKREHSGTL